MPRMLEELDVVARRHGIAVDLVRHYRWAAWEALRDRRRARAARYFWAAALRGDPGSIVRAVVALAWPGVAERRARARGGSPSWTAGAEEWVRPLASGRGSGP